MTEKQFKLMAEAAVAAADGCVGCFLAKASLPTRVEELARQLDAAGAKTFAELDAKNAPKVPEPVAAPAEVAKTDEPAKG